MPVLDAGNRDWTFRLGLFSCTQNGPLTIYENDRQLLGVAIAEAQFPLEAQTFEIYRRFLPYTLQGWHLYRVWNFVPAINDATDGLENYRSFCVGRSRAFQSVYGADCEVRMPAASGVGNASGQLAMLFLCGREAPIHLENPLQVPAYKYPSLYSPRAPSFARATVAGDAAFVAGTASIRGHKSIGVGDLGKQLEVSVGNLQEMLRRIASTGMDLAARQRHIVAYVRNPQDLPETRAYLDQHLLTDGDRVVYLEADVCRSDLLVEIEMTLF